MYCTVQLIKGLHLISVGIPGSTFHFNFKSLQTEGIYQHSILSTEYYLHSKENITQSVEENVSALKPNPFWDCEHSARNFVTLLAFYLLHVVKFWALWYTVCCEITIGNTRCSEIVHFLDLSVLSDCITWTPCILWGCEHFGTLCWILNTFGPIASCDNVCVI